MLQQRCIFQRASRVMPGGFLVSSNFLPMQPNALVPAAVAAASTLAPIANLFQAQFDALRQHAPALRREDVVAAAPACKSLVTGCTRIAPTFRRRFILIFASLPRKPT